MTEHPVTARSFRTLLAIVFALSGFSALAYQVAWQRVLTQVIGSDAVSVVLIVATFMIWLGTGAEIARRILPRIRRRAGIAYAALETLVGLAGVVSIPVLRFVNARLAETGNLSLSVDVAVNMLLLAVPVIGMGMSTPLIVELAKRSMADLGRTVGLFYGLNIFGAALGALATGLILIEVLGLQGVTVLAACLNVGVGLAVFVALRQDKGKDKGRGQPFKASANTAPAIHSARLRLGTAVVAILFGFGTLALQIVFFRVLTNYFTLSVIVFPSVLFAYLILMSAGQFVGGRLADRFPGRLVAISTGLFASGAVLFLLALRFPPHWAAEIGALSFTSFNGQLLSDGSRHLIGDPSPLTVALFSIGFMLAVLPWAALFPVMIRLATRDVAEASGKFAAIYGFYTVGNLLGAIMAGLVFLEFVGTGGTAAATIIITGAGAVLLAWRYAPDQRARLAGAAVLASVLAAALVPQNYYASFRLDAYRIAEVYEGRTGVATVVPTSQFYTIIDMNRTASASAMNTNPQPKDVYEAWRWNHTELMALDPEFRPKRILIIGIGHAYLIDAFLDLPFVEQITVVELSQEIYDAVAANTLTSTARIFDDPRVDFVIADGRRFVQKALARGERYDLIQTKINEPWHAGSGNLFTVEFFASQKDLLTPGGYLGVRPVAGHVVDGLAVFGAAIWPGYYHMFFKNGELAVPTEAVVTPDIRDAWFKALPGPAGEAGPREDHLDVVVFQCCEFGDGIRHNTDDRPSFEYDWLARTFGRWASPRKALWSMDLESQKLEVDVVR